MSKGQGFARRVTLDTLEDFAPLLGQKPEESQDEDAANEKEPEQEASQEQREVDPAMQQARSKFDGDSIKLTKPARASRGTGTRNKRARQQAPRQPEDQPTNEAPPAVTSFLGATWDLVWESKPLTRRDLTIPTASGTNPTGSVNLDKGLLAPDVDHRHYFREEVFAHLAWPSQAGQVDTAEAIFGLKIGERFYGVFELTVRHTTSRTSVTYIQRNAMTRLSWGPIREHIAREQLIDHTLKMYRDRDDKSRFLLHIDG